MVNGIDLDRLGDFLSSIQRVKGLKGTDIVYNLLLFRFSALPLPHPFPHPSS